MGNIYFKLKKFLKLVVALGCNVADRMSFDDFRKLLLSNCMTEDPFTEGVGRLSASDAECFVLPLLDCNFSVVW